MRTFIYYDSGIVGGDGLSPVRAEADRIGLVLPVYHEGYLMEVARFAAQLKDLKKRSLFVVCPVGDISMVKMKPVWNHPYEQCFACFHWCPQEARHFREATLGRIRYHHPEVTILDVLSRLQLAEVELGISEGGGADE